MSGATGNVVAIRPAPATATSPPQSVIDRGCAEIVRRLRRYMPEPEAHAEANTFRRRFELTEPLAVHHFLAEAELDTVLANVADAMGEP